MLEAFKDKNNNIQFGLDSHDSGIPYLSDLEMKHDEAQSHALSICRLIKNTKTTYAPTLRSDSITPLLTINIDYF